MVAGSAGPVPVGPDDTLSIFTALREQLDLELESSRGSAEIVEVDAAQLPHRQPRSGRVRTNPA